MMKHDLIVTIVPHDQGELIMTAAKKAGASGGTIIMGQGTASNTILELLGLGSSSKDITYNIVESEITRNVLNEIKSAAQSKSHFGVMFTIDLNCFVKSGDSDCNKFENSRGETPMENTYQMINVIVNKGYGEDAMAAARKAGAGGGTIIHARGTARPGDESFFGIQIVPEKENIMILVPKEKTEGIVEAIRALPCFAEKGSGIIFCCDAGNFTLLGK